MIMQYTRLIRRPCKQLDYLSLSTAAATISWRSGANSAALLSWARTSPAIAANCSVSKVAPAPFGLSVTKLPRLTGPERRPGFDATKDLRGCRNGCATHGRQIGQVAALAVQQGRAAFEMKIVECH